MKRRDFLVGTGVGSAIGSAAGQPLVVPIYRTMDSRAKCTPEQLRRFASDIWPEAVRDFGRGGIQLKVREGKCEIKRSPGGNPVFAGVERGVINMVVTDHIPEAWDKGRALAGLTTIEDGYHLCVIALQYAHGHQIPFLSVNTCVHELLHLLLQDVFVNRPKWYQSSEREFRVDSYATGLWLFHDGAAIRKSAEEYLKRAFPSRAVTGSLAPNYGPA